MEFNLPSYRDLQPLERGGIRARRGFNYQDHVSVRFCLQMLTESTLLEVWCEHLDDVLLVWQENESEVFEFVQVKQYDLDQLWSVAKLVQPDKKVKTEMTDEHAETKTDQLPSSILEKSLANDRGREPCRFRLVTSLKPKKILAQLTLPLSHSVRCGVAFEKLTEELVTKLPHARSGNGNDAAFWAKRTTWEVHDSSETLKLKNLDALRRFGEQHGKNLQEDQWNEIYNKVLQRVQDASLQLEEYDSRSQRLLKAEFTVWLQTAIDEASRPSQMIGGGLLRKLEDVNLGDRLQHAGEQRMSYRRRTLESGYFDLAPRDDVEAAVRHVLNNLIVQLDAGQLEPGLPFYTLCLTELKELAKGLPGQSFTWPSLLEGYMYDITQRCVHRFGKPII
jgi:Cap4 dsDNA endonuclease